MTCQVLRMERIAMRTRDEVENAAHLFGDDRWTVWMKCGVHNWQTLPQTDSGDHYCPNCFTMRTHAGAILNVPVKPATQG
jgi:hypothetical protein